MNPTQAFVLGVLQGVAEWLPVSSEGVIVFVMLNFFHTNPSDALSYAIFLHLGTMLASLLKFRSEFTSIMRLIIQSIRSLIRLICFQHTQNARNARNAQNARDAQNSRNTRSIHGMNGDAETLLRVVFIATAATGVTGVPLLLLLHHLLEGDASRAASVIVTFLIGVLLIFTGVFIGLPSRRRRSHNAACDMDAGMNEIKNTRVTRANEKGRDMGEMSLIEIVALGIMQGFAVLPGISRSGMTISYLLLRRINQEHALKISFIISVPAVIGAIAIESLQGIPPVNVYTAAIMLTSSLIIGYATMDVLLKIATSINFSKFCILIGVIAIIAAVIVK